MKNRKPLNHVQRPLDDTDVTTCHLPDGAIARLGRGVIRNIAISSEKRILTVATHIGTWVYQLDTMQPVALLAGLTHTTVGGECLNGIHTVDLVLCKRAGNPEKR